jgi:hypothetical protein
MNNINKYSLKNRDENKVIMMKTFQSKLDKNV